MAASSRLDPEFVSCPYNILHQMKRNRLQQHLLKCRLSYPDVEIVKCPFDQTHMVPKPEFEIHVLNCPGRSLITQYKYGAAETEEEREKQPIVECDENWDDCSTEDYNPEKYAKSSNVLRRTDLMQPAARKMFAKEERKRLGYDSDDENNVNVRKEQSDSDEDNRPPTPPPPKWDSSPERSNTPSNDDIPSCSVYAGIKLERGDSPSHGAPPRPLSRINQERGDSPNHGAPPRPLARFKREHSDSPSNGDSPRPPLRIKRRASEDFSLEDDPYYHSDEGDGNVAPYTRERYAAPESDEDETPPPDYNPRRNVRIPNTGPMRRPHPSTTHKFN